MFNGFSFWEILSFTILIFAIGQNVYIKHLNYELSKADYQISALSKQLTDQNNAIGQIVVAQQDKASQIDQALADAESLRKKFDKQALSMLSQNVSKNCEKAMRWGAGQGHAIYASWAA